MGAGIEFEPIEGEVIQPPTDVATTEDGRGVDYFANWITQSWRESMEGIMETGRRLVEAKKALDHGDYLLMVAEKLPFGDDTALRLRKIAECPHFSNPAPVRDLPHSYSILYEMIGIPDKEFVKLTESGLINKNTTRAEIVDIKRALKSGQYKGNDGKGADKGAGKEAENPGVRSVNQPKFFMLRLTHGEGVMLQDLFSTANQLGMVSKWLNERYAQKSKGRPDPHNLMNKFKMLELPELPLFVRD
ncbi:MAG: DUF3102 domain-containing protein [Magnetococcales bacterium]|nr:DUF3102 domain-containing protein [Magnetococcales bacterium]